MLNTFIYAFWDQADSVEEPGWYLTKVMSVNSDGSLTLKYRKGNTFETIHPDNIRWIEARGNDKWFREPGDIKSFSKPHKVKGFADDITIISKSPKDHSDALHQISSACSDLNLVLKPPKCVSFVFDGKKIDKNATFDVGTGQTRNIPKGPTKILGHILGACIKQGNPTGVW